ncbi:outer arm dynein light chain 1 protein [Artemisia annua]|uniref:Outer arm dynein light chain 1 protein n=1 Tax=Artemisia annua TaxID=35608 RepID=A0A2U1LBX7_ARTAN|nr:outer arm dynein light chain 1 protein [Artemisia annua]
MQKTVHLPTETMQKTLEDYSISKPKKDPVFSKEVSQGVNANPSPSSMGQDWKSEGLKSMNDTDSEHAHEIRKMRKSISLGSGLARYQDIASGGESSSSRGNRSGDGYQQGRTSVSPQISSNLVNNNASDLSPDDQPRSDKEVGDNSTRFSAACTSTSHSIVKSKSMPYLHSNHANLVQKSRSYEDLKVLDSRRSDKSVDKDAGDTSPEQGIENECVAHVDKTDGDDGDGDGEDAYDYEGSAKDWIVPAVNELDKGKGIQEDYSDCQWEELPNEDFKMKRIEKWVMDLQHSSSLEETDMLMNLDPDVQNGKDAILDPMAASKNDAKALLGMDAAKRYISSLSAAATTAQLANHGLVMIPFLSALSSLRALNLSGNSIVRITAGALPRGLHILNLSKNSISTIEGLRELTRLRVLDLSYNRILRIGHGLASCSSLKELYLAGNKISEVEGLHRLLKLNVLDLRFNKLSTTKNLGQLAANHSSLQAISLEGNPAQKNIGDEQLKKFLLGLLPHLAYFNRQSIKTGALKDSADRAARLGISAHQIDRGVRAESKKTTHGRKSQAVSGRGRHVRLPPSGVKVTGDRHQFPDVSSKLVSFRPDLGMRRTHSEGLLRAA